MIAVPSVDMELARARTGSVVVIDMCCVRVTQEGRSAYGRFH